MLLEAVLRAQDPTAFHCARCGHLSFPPGFVVVGFRATKAPALPPRPWPLLTSGQAPTDLSARVAFHLHRLGIGTKKLRAATALSVIEAKALRVGTSILTSADVARLEDALGLPGSELGRVLNQDEDLEWAFYRISARHPRQVWTNAVALARAANCSLRQIEKLTAIDHGNVSHILAGRTRRPVLTRPMATPLANHIGSVPEAFLDDLELDPTR